MIIFFKKIAISNKLENVFTTLFTAQSIFVKNLTNIQFVFFFRFRSESHILNIKFQVSLKTKNNKKFLKLYID